MHVLDRTHLCKKSEYFGDALGIMKRLGLFQLMDIQCHYNEKVIQQFYATLAFQADESLTSGCVGTQCVSPTSMSLQSF
jgi:hypothetical protein